MKILVIEDDRAINRSVCDALKNLAVCESAYDGEDGLSLALDGAYDCVILDIMMPKMDGFEVLKGLRKHSSVPVIMLTARGDVSDKVKGLKEGADDYLAKPFARDELLARVEAVIRRKTNQWQNLVIKNGALALDLEKRKLSVNGVETEICGKQLDILEYLMLNKNIIVTKEQIFNRIWGLESYTTVTVVEVYFCSLRKMLKQYGAEHCIKTVRNVGYIMEAYD